MSPSWRSSASRSASTNYAALRALALPMSAPGPGADIGRASARNAAKAADPDLDALERQLGDILGLKVQVTHKGQGGAVTLQYSSLDQLDMICQRLSGEPI